ncbi:MAG: pilus assembly protein [Chloroflexota bacterium]|nr:pilus assembly protein [Chloroflexota bacterium]
MRPLVSSGSAQALIEFALVLPFLLAFAFAIVLVTDVGVARLALEHAAAEGARVGSLTNDDASIESAIRAAVAPLPRDRVVVTIEPREHDAPRSNDPRGSILRVELRYVVPVPLGFAGLPSVAVAGSAARVIEWTP